MALGGNFLQSLKDYDFRDWIRIIVIVCGYILMRQQFVQWRTRRYQRQQEEEDDVLKQEAHEEAKRVALEKMESKVKGTSAKSSGASWGWGNTAKERFEKRRKYIEKQAMRKAEMAQNEVDIDSDDEINELLH
ncbi:uncharacterized protein SAPINGB_P003724 [Magnusiomyces paraingens]|uniref:Processing of GAS1 and ALP protein 2 n=1 Tax=Magnusiomyces paraingens TaxID=2606893 RepID=A0A5E8BW81_9ASCO|nr:uncharacterized protein SAPINGB_P003724 [Saprochaete ingens]VVT53737.1 unnamed protein product [Saprochaete ingens]